MVCRNKSFYEVYYFFAPVLYVNKRQLEKEEGKISHKEKIFFPVLFSTYSNKKKSHKISR